MKLARLKEKVIFLSDVGSAKIPPGTIIQVSNKTRDGLQELTMTRILICGDYHAQFTVSGLDQILEFLDESP